MVQRLRLCASNTRGMGLIPGQGNKIPHAMQYRGESFFFFLIWLKKRGKLKIARKYWGPERERTQERVRMKLQGE